MRIVFATFLAILSIGSAVAQTTPASPAPATPPAVQTPAAPAAATPARRPRQTMQQRFDAANTTHDGKLTLDQAKAARMTRVSQHFDAIDTGKKGYVTTDDIRAYNRAQRAAAKAAKH